MLFPRSSGFDFAAIRWSDACRNALFAGARTVQRLPGASYSAPVRQYRFQHGGLAATRRSASADFEAGRVSEFRRVSLRFAERAYRMAFSL